MNNALASNFPSYTEIVVFLAVIAAGVVGGVVLLWYLVRRVDRSDR